MLKEVEVGEKKTVYTRGQEYSDRPVARRERVAKPARSSKNGRGRGRRYAR